MKKKISSAIAFILLVSMSCSDSTQDSCLEAVQIAYPNAIVWKNPSMSYGFVVCDSDGAVYYLKTMNNLSNEITSKEIIKHKNK